jgi:hypothetical protein
MKCLSHLTASSPVPQQSIDGVLNTVANFRKEIPELVLISLSVFPAMQPPSIQFPGGAMSYMACAVVELEDEDALAKFMELGKAMAAPGMTIVK